MKRPIKWDILTKVASYIPAITNSATMVKYSALVLFVTLAVFWSGTEAKEQNRYQNDVINAMTKWAKEELRDLPEPHHSRIVAKLDAAQNREWENVGEYFKYLQRSMMETVTALLRSKRSLKRYASDESFEDSEEVYSPTGPAEAISKLGELLRK